MNNPKFASPFLTQFWTIAVMFTRTTPSAAVNEIPLPFTAGEPGTVKACHVAPDSVQASVSWYSSCVPPEGFVIVNSRVADTTVDPGVTCPALGPMKSGNLIKDLHTTLLPTWHPDASTNRLTAVPKFVPGAPLEMYVSSVA